MQTTRREVLDDFLDFVGEAEDVRARNVAERVLNMALETLWLKHPWKWFMSPAPFEIQLRSMQRSYPLPEHFGRIAGGRVKNVTTGGKLIPITSEQLDDRDPAAGTTHERATRPDCYLVQGTVGVHTQPDCRGEALSVSSDVATDGVVITIIGEDADGRERREQTSLVGSIPKPVGVWSYIDSFSKQYPFGTEPPNELQSSQGTVTLSVTLSGLALQSLFPYETQRTHQIITFYPKPAQTDTIAIPIMRKVDRLIFDADPIPDHWGPALREQMLRTWRVNTGETAEESDNPGPRFLDLLAFDNANQHGVPLQIKAFRG